jgi:hypothetical protein
VYDGEALLLGGRVDAAGARKLLAGQDVHPVVDRKGRVLAGMWVCEFSQAGLGPHLELQLSLAVTREAIAPVAEGPFELLRLILLEPGLRLFSAGLWNDVPAVVAYNRELLGLDAQLATAHVSRGEEGGFISFRFETVSADLVCQGDIAPPREQPFWDSLRVEQALGREGMRRMAGSPWICAQVMAPGGAFFRQPSEAQTYLQARSTVLARYDCAAGHLEFGPGFPAGLDFHPMFVEHFLGFQFVYLLPYNCGDAFDGTPAA